MMRKNNHPAPGSTIKVEPIRNLRDIAKIKRKLANKPRDFAIFVAGINTNLRASDLRKIKVGQVRHLKPGDTFDLKEKKTSKHRGITINPAVYEAIQNLLNTMPDAQDDNYLFPSRKGGGALTVSYLNSLVKGWADEIGLKGNFGSHTLRKTFGYIHRTEFGTDIPTLMELFNHSSQKQTLAYLGIQPQEIQDAYMREI
jgi:integrase